MSKYFLAFILCSFSHYLSAQNCSGLIGGSSSACDGETITYSANSCALPSYASQCVLSYDWTVTGGSPTSGSGSSISVTWGASGGSVRLRVRNTGAGGAAICSEATNAIDESKTKNVSSTTDCGSGGDGGGNYIPPEIYSFVINGKEYPVDRFGNPALPTSCPEEYMFRFESNYLLADKRMELVVPNAEGMPNSADTISLAYRDWVLKGDLPLDSVGARVNLADYVSSETTTVTFLCSILDQNENILITRSFDLELYPRAQIEFTELLPPINEISNDAGVIVSGDYQRLKIDLFELNDASSGACSENDVSIQDVYTSNGSPTPLEVCSGDSGVGVDYLESTTGTFLLSASDSFAISNKIHLMQIQVADPDEDKVDTETCPQFYYFKTPEPTVIDSLIIQTDDSVANCPSSTVEITALAFYSEDYSNNPIVLYELLKEGVQLDSGSAAPGIGISFEITDNEGTGAYYVRATKGECDSLASDKLPKYQKISNTITIDFPDSLVANDALVSSETCFNANDGRIEIPITGGTGSYDIISIAPVSLADNFRQTTEISDSVFIESLAPGNYNISFTVRDSNNCPLTVSIEEQIQGVSAAIGTSKVEVIEYPSCLQATDGKLEITPTGGSGGDYTLSDVKITKSDGSDYEDFRINQTSNIIEDIPANCTIDFILNDAVGCPSDLISYTVGDNLTALNFTNFDSGTDPSCFGEKGSVYLDLMNLNALPITKQIFRKNTQGADEDVTGEVTINHTASSNKVDISGIEPNATYYLNIGQGSCSIPIELLEFTINEPIEANMSDPVLGTGGIKLGESYYVQCHNESISINWPINSDSELTGTYTITKDGIALVGGGPTDDYSIYSDRIVLHNANVQNATTTTYAISGTDGDLCTLVTSSFDLEQAQNPFQIDAEKTTKDSLYSDANGLEYHLKHAESNEGKVYIEANGGIDLGGAPNYSYELYDDDQDTLVSDTPQIESENLYYFDGLQAQINYKIYLMDGLACLLEYEFDELNAPDTIRINTTLNDYATDTNNPIVNIACKNGTDTVKVQTSGGLYPHFIELKSGDSTYFSQTLNSNEDTVFFPTVHSGNYYIQVTDKYDSHYPQEMRFDRQSEDFDMLEPADSVGLQFEMQEPTCFYSLNGELTITPSGGVPFDNQEYIIKFFNNSTNILLDSVKAQSATYIDSAGFYRVEVYDANTAHFNTSCFLQEVLEIENIPQLQADTIYSDHPLCVGDSTGILHVSATGGRSEDTYYFSLYDSLDQFVDSAQVIGTKQYAFENLFSGVYTVKVFDEASCEFESQFLLKERTDTLKIVNIDPIKSLCTNTVNAAIDVETFGGDGRHSLSIDQGQNWIQLDSSVYTYRFDSLEGGQRYEVWLKDENFYEESYLSSCLIVDDVFIPRTDSVSFSAEVRDVSCFGGEDGEITINPSYGGNTDASKFSFVWYKNDTLVAAAKDDSLEDQPIGEYQVKITYDNIVCTEKTLDFRISQPSKPFEIDSINAQAYSCESNDSLKIQVGFSGGWLSNIYKVQIDNLAPDSVRNNGSINLLEWYEFLEDGEHQLRIWDAKGCQISDSFTIEYQQPTLEIVSTQDVFCAGGSNGSIKVMGQYELMDYYLWNQDSSMTYSLEEQHQDSVLFEGLALGIYYLMAKKGSCVSERDTITINQPDQLVVTPYILKEATCGRNNGALDLSFSGGTGPFKVSWLNGIDPDAVGAGNYLVLVEDSLGCSVTANIKMIETSPIVLSVDSIKGTHFDQNDGFARISVSGATKPYQIYWNGIAGDSTKADLAEGEYFIEVEDALGCTKDTVFQIEASLPIEASVTSFRAADCKIPNGYIEFSYDNLTSPFEVEWPESVNPVDEYSANGLLGGLMYELKISDSDGYTLVVPFSIPTKSDLAIEFEVEEPSCANASGQIKANVSGGSGSYSYLWSNGIENADSISELPAGFYYLTIEDGNGCQLTDSVTLRDNEEIFPDYEVVEADPSCLGNDGSIEIQLLGNSDGFEIYWTETAAVSNRLDDLEAGTYTAQLINQEGCLKEISVSLQAFQEEELLLESIKFPGCGSANGEIMVSELSGWNYTWSDVAVENTSYAKNLLAGTYWVYADNGAGCATDTLNFTLDNKDSNIIIQTTSIIASSCLDGTDGSIEVNAVGGTAPYSYLWDDTEQQIGAKANDLLPGNYTVLVTDANQCSTSKSFNLRSESPVFIASFEPVEPQCHNSSDGSLKVNVLGGKGNYSYEWTNGDTTETATALPKGVHGVTVYDGGTCYAYSEFNLGGPDSIDLDLDVGAAVCRGEATAYVNLNIKGGSGPYQVEWEDGSTLESRSDLTSGSYIVAVSDASQCDQEFEFEVPEKEPIIAQYQIINPSCVGAGDGRIEIGTISNAENPLISWDTGRLGRVLNNITAGTYYYEIIDNSNCSVRDSIVVSDPDPIEIVNLEIAEPLCYGDNTGSISFEIQGGAGNYQLDWSDNFVGKNRSGLTAGSYILAIVDDNGCTLEQAFQIEQPDLIEVDYTVSGVSCFGNSDGSIDLNVIGGSGGYSFLWNDGSTVLQRSDLSAGAYNLMVTDTNNCTQSIDIVVPQPQPLDVLVQKTEPSCNGASDGSLEVTVTGGNSPYGIEWGNGSTSPTLDSLAAGSYTLKVTDAKGCEFNTNISLSQPSIVRVAQEITENPVCFQEPSGYAEIIPTGGVKNYAIEWQDGNSLFQRSDLMAGEHFYTISDGNGCSYSDAIQLVDPSEIKISGLQKEVYLCGSGSLILDGGENWTSYNWFADNGYTSTGREAEISQEGVYTLQTTNADGCTDEFTFEVYKDDNLLDTDFLLTSDAILGDTVVIVDVSWPKPDSILWDNRSDPDVYVVSQSENYQEVIFTRTGSFEVGMSAFISLCQDDIRKSIQVMSPEVAKMQREMRSKLGNDISLEINVYPNPNYGIFRLNAELTTPGDIEIHIFDLNKGRVITSIKGKENTEYVFDIENQSLPAGVYLAMAQSGDKTVTKKFVVK